MKIIYCHHAERDVDPRKLRSQDDDLTDNGIKDAELVSELLANQKINAIYTSTFYRCKKTAQIINRTLNIPIVEEERFNEVGSVEGEEWKNALQRNIDAIVNIQEKFNDDEIIRHNLNYNSIMENITINTSTIKISSILLIKQRNQESTNKHKKTHFLGSI